MRVLSILAIAHQVAGWGRYPMPQDLGLTELMSRLQDAGAPATSNMGLVDQINQLVIESADTVSKSQNLVEGHMKELYVTYGIVNKTIEQVAVNEANRIALIRDYNKNALSLNRIHTDMTTGAQQINDVLSMSQRTKKNLHDDIRRINDAIDVTNDWLVKMDEWASFVRSEKSKIDEAQAGLVKWGDRTKQNLNLHEVSATKLAREAYDLETQISDLTNIVLSCGELLGYKPKTLTIPEVSGGLGWEYTFWS